MCVSVCVRVLYYFQLTRQSRVHAVAKHNHTDCAAAAAAATVNVVAAVARILNRVRRTLLARVYVYYARRLGTTTSARRSVSECSRRTHADAIRTAASGNHQQRRRRARNVRSVTSNQMRTGAHAYCERLCVCVSVRNLLLGKL